MLFTVSVLGKCCYLDVVCLEALCSYMSSRQLWHRFPHTAGFSDLAGTGGRRGGTPPGCGLTATLQSPHHSRARPPPALGVLWWSPHPLLCPWHHGSNRCLLLEYLLSLYVPVPGEVELSHTIVRLCRFCLVSGHWVPSFYGWPMNVTVQMQ